MKRGTSFVASLFLVFVGTHGPGFTAHLLGSRILPEGGFPSSSGSGERSGFLSFPGLDRSGTAVRRVTLPLPLANHYSLSGCYLSKMLSIQRRAYLPGAPPAYVREFYHFCQAYLVPSFRIV